MFCVRISDDTPIHVPYERQHGDPNSHAYINLKLEPGRERELPELQRSAILKDIVLALNAQTTLKTFGCEKWTTHPWEAKLWPEYDFQTGSYVDLAFTDARKIDRAAYAQLIDEFLKTKIAPAST